MKHLIILTFAALSVCFGRAQKADGASETFHTDTIAVKGHGLVIFDKIPDPMVIAINSAKNCQDITVYNPRNPEVRIDMTFRPSVYLDFSKLTYRSFCRVKPHITDYMISIYIASRCFSAKTTNKTGQ